MNLNDVNDVKPSEIQLLAKPYYDWKLNYFEIRLSY